VLQEEEKGAAETYPWWMDYAKKAAKPAFNMVLIGLFLLLAVRPFRKWMRQNGRIISQPAALPGGLQPAGTLPGQAIPAGAGPATALSEGDSATSSLLEISKGNPEAVAAIIRSWLSEGR
jgi:flagellar biosynthesis/type III secretory pathway M-ring protein FliF/YscJ